MNNWITSYYDAIFQCVGRYREMIDNHESDIVQTRIVLSDLRSFLDEFKQAREIPVMKLNRWLGYVQGVLISQGVTSVQAERDWTRPLFRPLDFGE